ncbi:Actin-fragmin kinase, partial [Tetrabaena socialis]
MSRVRSTRSTSDGAPPDCDPHEYEYEWIHPELSGDDPGARGYHAACASEDGLRLFVFGGIARRQSIAALEVIELSTGRVELLATTGPTPSPRFGCSLVAYGGRLWVVGGGNGCDLARSGHDLADVLTLDLATLEWARVETTNRPHSP